MPRMEVTSLVGAIGRGYAATLDELTAHRRGRGGGLWGDFIVKT